MYNCSINYNVYKAPRYLQAGCIPGILARFARDCVSVEEPILSGCLILMSYVKYK